MKHHLDLHWTEEGLRYAEGWLNKSRTVWICHDELVRYFPEVEKAREEDRTIRLVVSDETPEQDSVQGMFDRSSPTVLYLEHPDMRGVEIDEGLGFWLRQHFRTVHLSVTLEQP